jgi:hypothetical protein
MALRVARLALVISILSLVVLLGLGAVGIAPGVSPEYLFLGYLIVSGWTVLSAVACLVLQVALWGLTHRTSASGSKIHG